MNTLCMHYMLHTFCKNTISWQQLVLLINNFVTSFLEYVHRIIAIKCTIIGLWENCINYNPEQHNVHKQVEDKQTNYICLAWANCSEALVYTRRFISLFQKSCVNKMCINWHRYAKSVQNVRTYMFIKSL